MSTNSDSDSDPDSRSNASSDATDDVPVGREVAYRLFAAEYDDASLSHTESDEERAPNYVITPTGARINRLFVVGTLTEVTPVNDEMVRARVVDPTGAFVVYAGQYQPEALAFLERADPPLFVAVTGKARTFQPEDSERVYTSIRPENIATVDADTRDRWVVSSAEQTLERIASYATAATVDARGDELVDVLLESGFDAGLALGIPLAQDHYGTTPDYLEGLRTLALDAVRVVADERSEVGSFDLNPGDSRGTSGASFDALSDASDLAVEAVTTTETAASTAETTGETTLEADAESELDADGDVALDADTGGDASETAETGETATSADESAGVVGGETASASERENGGERDRERESESESESENEDELAPSTASADSNDFTSEMYEMDDEERAELEEEFGAEFSTGAELEESKSDGSGAEAEEDEVLDEDDAVAESSDTDIDTATETGAESAGDGALGDFQPESDGLEVADENEGQTEAESEAEPGDEDGETVVDEPVNEADAADAADEDEADEESLEDVDLQEYAVDTMRDLDDGDGADRAAVVERVTAETGADEEDVEAAIADALMGGQCYEPDDETLKAI